MCEETGKYINISVEPKFLDSNKDVGGYFWTYDMKILNQSNKAVQIITKYIDVVDESGNKLHFTSSGILGEKVVLQPDQKIEYSSGIPLFSPSGIATGEYLMYSETGDDVRIPIPAFSLDSPYGKKIIN